MAVLLIVWLKGEETIASKTSLNQSQETPMHLPILATVITQSHMHVEIKHSLAHVVITHPWGFVKAIPKGKAFTNLI